MLYKLSLTSREESDIRVALDGSKYLACLTEITNTFRSKAKYEGNPDTRWDIAYDLLWQVLREHEIDPLSEE